MMQLFILFQIKHLNGGNFYIRGSLVDLYTSLHSHTWPLLDINYEIKRRIMILNLEVSTSNLKAGWYSQESLKSIPMFLELEQDFQFVYPFNTKGFHYMNVLFLTLCTIYPETWDMFDVTPKAVNYLCLVIFERVPWCMLST